MPNFHVIFHVICFFSTNEDLLEKALTTDSFWNMYRKLAVLKRIKREKDYHGPVS